MVLILKIITLTPYDAPKSKNSLSAAEFNVIYKRDV